MTRWTAFAGFTLVVLSLLLLLARASASFVVGGGGDGDRSTASNGESSSTMASYDDTVRTEDPLDAVGGGEDRPDAVGGGRGPDTVGDWDSADAFDGGNSPGGSEDQHSEGSIDAARSAPGPEEALSSSMSTSALLANVWFSHALFAVLFVGGILLTEVPPSALGLTDAPLSTGALAAGVGVAVGVVLSVANGLVGGLAAGFGVDPSRELRARLTPETAGGWAFLLGVVLPTIAVFEELLFRAALVGAFAVGFGVSPWALAVVSSVAFALGHGVQGGLGVVVTGLFGFALAVAFVLTNSLLVVVVAHYVVNAAEFVVVERLGWEPFGDSTG